MEKTSLKHICDQFSTNNPCIKVTGYGSGNIHDTYICKTQKTQQDYLLQKINSHVFPSPQKVMENIAHITSFLRSKWDHLSPQDAHRRVLNVVKTKDNNLFYHDHNQNAWRMYEFIHSTKCYQNITSAIQGYKTAKTLAIFQKMLLDFPLKNLHMIVSRFHNIAQRFTTLENTIAKDPLNRYKDISHLGKKLLQLRDFCQMVASFEESLPLRVVHNDPKVNNVLFDTKSEAAICMVDLDLVMPGFTIYDFGDLARSATCHKQQNNYVFRIDYFQAILEGYIEEANDFLDTNEKKYLLYSCKIIACELAFRFLTDYLEGDKYFKITHPKHNIERVIRQIEFIDSLDKQESSLKKMFKNILG